MACANPVLGETAPGPRRAILASALVTVLLLLLAAPSRAQYTDSPAWSSAVGQPARGVALGDVDLDGDLDLVCGNFAGRDQLFLNSDGLFELTPVWESPTADNTYQVALADVEGDGDLDLVCANTVRSDLYRNDGGQLTSDPVWSSPVTPSTFAVLTLGDVDGDGDPDLVVSRAPVNVEVYRNDGGALTALPVWTSPLTEDVVEVALGDVDNDGDLDLVCGSYNPGEISKLYRNDAGTWSVPIALPSPAEGSADLALGDVDGDGDLDLVHASRQDSNELYRNAGGGTFEPTPAWLSATADSTHEVVLGDVDCDGDLDLVCLGLNGDWTDVYLNIGGTFTTAPACSVGWADDSQDVALGDVDADGDLDMVYGSDNGPLRLFLAEGRMLETGPGWLSSRTDQVFAVALGDMDGDGDADLVCGNASDQANTLYRNDGGMLSTLPAWTSSAEWTEAIALGDVDKDGDLDLVCGNTVSEPNTLYRNDGGMLTAAPVWTSLRMNDTDGVSLGDVDGDGDLDLACGNLGQKATLYRNDDGMFTADTVWASGPVSLTTAVALGDVDGDGDPDLVCANRGANTLYRNDGGVLARTPSWASGQHLQTTSVALGDVDGDGDLDLAFGNSNQTDTVYRNDGGTFGLAPSWYSVPTRRTSGVVFADVDGDGDLDLVCAHNGQPNAVYVNHGGVLADTTAWVSVPANNTQDVAVGDVDGDGDVDLVFGNPGQQSTMYAGITRPVYKGDPAVPRNHLPNNGAHLRGIRRTSPSTNIVRLGFSVVDVESDPVWVLPEYSFEGSRAWQTVTMTDGSTRTDRIVSSPAGTPYTFDWDVSTFPADARDVVLRLRTISNPSRSGLIRHVASHDVHLGRIVPRRPVVQLAAGALVFPVVTLGDTVSVALDVSNAGDADLIVSGLALPSAEMSSAEVFPVVIAPRASHPLMIDLAPRNDSSISGDVVIQCNDPFAQSLAIPVETDIRDVAVATNALAPGSVTPLGEALTIQVIPADGVHVERGALHYRPSLGGVEFTSLELVPLGEAFIGVIPGSSVTEADLEFWVEVENSGIVRTDPPGAPQDSLFFQDVASPQGITTVAQGGGADRILMGQDLDILVQLAPGTEWLDGTVSYRRGGESAYRSVAVLDDGSGPRGTIPAEHVDARGLEYWVEVATRTNPRITDPSVNPEMAPRPVRVSVLDLEEDSTRSGSHYRILSVPLELDAEFQGTLEGLLADETEFGLYDPAKWRAFRYLPSEGRNAEITEGGARFRPVPGRGFWLISRQDHRVDTAPIEGLSTATDGDYAIVVEPGWNQVGNPFAFPVAWDTVTRSSAIEDPVAFDPQLGDYAEDPPVELVPFEAYFVRNTSAAPETLHVPPVEAQTTETSRALGVEAEWRLLLGADCPGGSRASLFLGIEPGASDARDEQDRPSPPPPPGRWIQLAAANREWSERPGLYRRDYRSAGVEGHRWDVELRSWESGVGVEIRAEEPQGRRSLAVRLIDLEQGTVTDLSREPSHRLVAFGPERPYRLALLAGTEAFVAREGAALVETPLTLVLDRNAPNPFRHATRLRFGLPRLSRVALGVYDLGGRRVARLVGGFLPAGYHTAVWDGRDEAGRRVAAGVYFFRLVTDDGTRTGRMVVIR